MAGTGSGRINPAGSCLPDIRPDSRIRKFEKAGYPGSGDPAKTPIRWNPTQVVSQSLAPLNPLRLGATPWLI